MSLYNSQGLVNVTVVDGNTFTGLYASNGGINVVINDGSTRTGIQHPCGGLNAVAVSSIPTDTHHTNGSIYVFHGDDGYTVALPDKTLPLAVSVNNYDPVSALGTKLIAYWDANRIDKFTMANNDNSVNHWFDIKAGYDAISPDLILIPKYLPKGLAAAPAVSFDGTSYLTCTDAALLAALPSGATPSETWIVCSQSAAPADTSTRYAVGWSGASVTSGRNIARIVTTGVNRARSYTGTGAAATTVDDTTTDFSGVHVIRQTVGATTSTINTDGGTTYSVAVVPSTTNTRLRIGSISAAGASNNWNGLISAILITTPLTGAEATALHNYLG